MTVWLYSGKSSLGKDSSGEINANSKEEAKALLRKRRIMASKITKKPIEIKLNFSKGAPIREISRFTRQFSAMTSSGLPLILCLETLGDQLENENLQTAVKKISNDIQGGETLSRAFGKHPKLFTELYTQMLNAGEAGGILDTILLRLADYLEKTEKLLRKIRGAMMYPGFVLLVSILVVIFLLYKVVPTFASMFTSAGSELPGPTMVVMTLSNFIRDKFIIILAILIIIPLGILRYYKSKKGRFVVDAILLKAPVLGVLIRKSSIARFTKTLGTLLNAGIPITEALRVTSRTTGNSVLEKGIIKALDSISGGQTIADPLQETGIFPPMVIQMISVGEKTGALAEMLEKIADFYDDEVDVAVENLTSLIEPLIIVFLGGVIGAILIAMYLPMFSMADQMG